MHYGKWTHNPRTRTIDHDDGYQVDLDRCRTSAEVLDWIAQISHKSWGDPETVGNLVKAIDEVLCLQATVCPGGVDAK
jgi:hypothetical protein